MLYLPSALSKITTHLFVNDCCLLVSRTLPLSLSQTYSGWWASFSAQCCCREWASFSVQFWTSGIHVFLVQQPSELSIEERTLLSGADKFPSHRCCSISVHIPTSFRSCGLQPVLHSKAVEHRSRKNLEISCRQEDSRLVTVSHIFVPAFSVVACCVLLRTCSFLSHPSLCMAQGGFDFVHVCTLSFV